MNLTTKKLKQLIKEELREAMFKKTTGPEDYESIHDYFSDPDRQMKSDVANQAMALSQAFDEDEPDEASPELQEAILGTTHDVLYSMITNREEQVVQMMATSVTEHIQLDFDEEEKAEWMERSKRVFESIINGTRYNDIDLFRIKVKTALQRAWQKHRRNSGAVSYPAKDTRTPEERASGMSLNQALRRSRREERRMTREFLNRATAAITIMPKNSRELIQNVSQTLSEEANILTGAIDQIDAVIKEHNDLRNRNIRLFGDNKYYKEKNKNFDFRKNNDLYELSKWFARMDIFFSYFGSFLRQEGNRWYADVIHYMPTMDWIIDPTKVDVQGDGWSGTQRKQVIIGTQRMGGKKATDRVVEEVYDYVKDRISYDMVRQYSHPMVSDKFTESKMKLTTKQLNQLIKEELMAFYEDIGDDLRPEQRVSLLRDPMDLQKLDGVAKDQPFKDSMKPHGLWYSMGDQWIQFAKSEMRDKFDDHEYLYDLQIKTTTIDKPDASAVLVLETQEDAEELFKRNGVQRISRYSALEVNWAWLARHYGGIEVRDMALHLFYGWDIDSGCIWNKNAITNIETLNQPMDYGQMKNIPEQALEDLKELLENWGDEWKLDCILEQDAECFGIHEDDLGEMKTIWNWMSFAFFEQATLDLYDLKETADFDLKDPWWRIGSERDLWILLHLMTNGIDSLGIAVEVGSLDDPHEAADKISKIFNQVYEKYGINKTVDISNNKNFENELRAQDAMQWE